MLRPSGKTCVIGVIMLLGGASCWGVAERARPRVIDAGFWFEPVTFASSRLGGAVTPQDIETIASVARSELTGAFAGLPITFAERRDARYRVRVAQELRDPRSRWSLEVAGESRAISGFGGWGSVSFLFLASAAVGCAPEDAPRASVIEAVGRGIGRAAVHEFAHQLLPTAPIHNTSDIRSYEYRSAGRCEQYFGEMHWDTAWPLLKQRVLP